MDNGNLTTVYDGTVWGIVRRHSRLILSVTAVCAVVGLAWQLFQPRHYTAFASFIGQSKRGGSPLAGFAAQFGLAGIGSDGAQSPQFFNDLVTSPGVLRAVAQTPYKYSENGREVAGTLVDIYQLDDPKTPYGLRLQHASEHLAKAITTSLAPKTGLISIQVRAPNPDLAVQIAQSIIEKVDAVNLRLRQTQAQADRQFAEMRVAELGSELHAAENRLQEFMATNKDFRASPRLSMEQERLSREVDMRQSVYGSMAASYEQDRIESVRDNPVVTIVDLPIRPAKSDSRGLGKGLVIGALLGGMLALLGGYLTETWARKKLERQLPIQPVRSIYEAASVS